METYKTGQNRYNGGTGNRNPKSRNGIITLEHIRDDNDFVAYHCTACPKDAKPFGSRKEARAHYM